VSESPERIRKHIAILEEFEQLFGEWVVGLHNEQMPDESPAWSTKERAERERKLRELAAPAERAMQVSGVGVLALGWPPAMRRPGVMVGDLPGLMFYEGPSLAYESSDGLDVQRMVLKRIPTQLAGLKLKLEEAEDLPPPNSTAPPSASAAQKRGWLAWLVAEVGVKVAVAVLTALVLAGLAALAKLTGVI
jgi:hypothetical protein